MKKVICIVDFNGMVAAPFPAIGEKCTVISECMAQFIDGVRRGYDLEEYPLDGKAWRASFFIDAPDEVDDLINAALQKEQPVLA